MYSVSSEFINAIRQPIKEIDSYILLADGQTTITPADDLVNIKIEGENGVGKLVMRKIEIKLLGYHSSLIDTLVTAFIGVKKATGFEYINYGQFLITEAEDSKDTGMCVCKGYDKVIYTNTKYEPVTVQYPCTVYQFAAAVCQRCGIVLGSSSWPNSTVILEKDRYAEIDEMQYRDVLTDIASSSGTIALLQGNTLYFKSVPTTAVETLTYDDLKTFKLQPKYGPVNGVVLARAPQEDNIALQDSESVAQYGLTEYRVENNQMVDDQRENFIQNLANQMFGFEYYPFEAKTIGMAYLEIGDRLTIQAEDGNYSVYISSFSISTDGSIQEVLKSSSAEKTTTNYARAGGLTKRLNRTEIVVDKQAGLIESAVEATGNLENDLEDAVSDLQGQINNQGTLIQQKVNEITLKAYQGVDGRLKSLETCVSVTVEGLKLKQNEDGTFVLITDSGMEMYVNGQKQNYVTNEGNKSSVFIVTDWYIQSANNGNSLIFFKKGSQALLRGRRSVER